MLPPTSLSLSALVSREDELVLEGGDCCSIVGRVTDLVDGSWATLWDCLWVP